MNLRENINHLTSEIKINKPQTPKQLIEEIYNKDESLLLTLLKSKSLSNLIRNFNSVEEWAADQFGYSWDEDLQNDPNESEIVEVIRYWVDYSNLYYKYNIPNLVKLIFQYNKFISLEGYKNIICFVPDEEDNFVLLTKF